MSNTERTIEPTPNALVEDGRMNFGTFKSPLRRVNALDTELRRAGVRLPRTLKRLALKEWQHFALASGRFYISIALFDSKRLGLVQVIVYDRLEQKKYEYERRVAPWQLSLPDELWDSKASFFGAGLAIQIQNRLSDGYHEISFLAAGGRGLPSLRGCFRITEDLSRVEPIVVCLPFENGRGMYSHKGIFPVSGELSLDGVRHEFSPDESYGLPDIHKGFYPFEMKWKWATGGGREPSGRLTGFNLTDNQVLDQERYNENALWLDGKLHLLPPVRFEPQGDCLTEPWQIRDRGETVRLRFIPEAPRSVDIHIGPLKSRYRGPYGRFEGWILDRDGERVEMGHAYGMCEDFYLRA